AAFSVGLAFSPRPLAYAPLLVAAGGAYGVLFTPAFALIAEGAERSGLAQGMAFGLMNAAWAGGALVGPAAGGAVADASGDVVPPEREPVRSRPQVPEELRRRRPEVAEVDDRAHPDEIEREPARSLQVELRRLGVEPEHARRDEDHVADRDRDAEPPIRVP